MRVFSMLARVAAISGIAMTVAAAQAQVTQKGDSYLFRQKFVKGQTYQYAMSNSSKVAAMPTGDFKGTTNITLKVLAVTNGVASVQFNSDGLAMNGKTVSKAQNFTGKMDSRGQSVGASGKGRGGLGPIYPEKPLRVGESFTSDGSASSGGAMMSAQVTYKLLGLKTYNGQKVAQFAVTGDMDGQMQGKVTGILLVSVADGQMVRSVTDATMTLDQQGKKMNISSHTAIDRK